MVPFWKEAMEMVLDVEPGVDYSCSCMDQHEIVHAKIHPYDGVVLIPLLKMKIPPRSQMFQLLNHLRKCYMGWYINDTF